MIKFLRRFCVSAAFLVLHKFCIIRSKNFFFLQIFRAQKVLLCSRSVGMKHQNKIKNHFGNYESYDNTNGINTHDSI